MGVSPLALPLPALLLRGYVRGSRQKAPEPQSPQGGGCRKGASAGLYMNEKLIFIALIPESEF